MSTSKAGDSSSVERKKKSGLAVVVGTKNAISKLKKQIAGKAAANVNNSASSVGKKIILAMEVNIFPVAVNFLTSSAQLTYFFMINFLCYMHTYETRSGCGAMTKTIVSLSCWE